ncbi:PEP-CTERM sorting domain-containing protein [Paracraurococcus ruber]|uniref:Ice-binding protein C-terminal domain-containing protein n=1 Tax=Paracraurococcus ruber TaxID=77675 RepID=A0ABS1CWE4_9PROT|nr:PEP-CTERM sorting domain-containing protein [Paracraurococcus ruber]MBK1658277.1 hypothetical protein [Paracraurococcus ruber]TDG31018.1 PEP-CTERM sorting domain-containing protein [Paracraurococcus ruber]
MNITKIVAAAALATTVAAGASQAATINGTAAAAITGISASAPVIGLGTTFTNTLFTAIGSGTGDLNGTAGTFLTLSTVTATAGTAVSFTSAVGNFTGTVQPIGLSASGPATSRVVDIYVLGNFTPAGTLSTFDPGAMSLTFSFTQTGGANSAVSGSFSIASPPSPPPGVPEPMSLALFGMGLAGLGMVARKKA